MDLGSLENKVDFYLKRNFYRILEKGSNHIIFADEEFSDRKRQRSDFHTRVDKGKSEFGLLPDNNVYLELTYYTSISDLIILFLLFTAFCIYTNNFVMPFFLFAALTVPILIRIYSLNKNVFEDLLR
ncbi:hypothetical protein [Mucilaginibacter sp. 44-25]|uniref:hypothetical protein n=1 Tax=Mucilaginibacter sp. 44-25 TaxID=1895794 RepID=UPI00096652E5|nr:hypothetical protein [Mucilaginibacter sp. 44-25]OJW17966.1 MAG: hypothetical protein BGO48_15400 [Mucilaginibacter sp. 44-25]